MDLENLLQRVKEHYPESDLELIRRAYEFAAQAHDGQLRASGEPYVQHSLETAALLADLRLDPATIAAALLHDVPEDTQTPLGKIRQEFGEEVTKLVDGVTKLSRIEWESLEEEEAESLRKMFLAMVDDIRVVLIKLADRLHNMRTLDALPEEKRKSFAQETLEIYAPLANRLGIWEMKWELEDLALQYLQPEMYREIASLLAEQRESRERQITDIITLLKSRLEQEGIKAEITGRPKHIYSIYQKMKAKEREFDEIYDIQGVRIIVDEVKDCYAALGIVHTLWRPIPGAFDDYIAMPKDNMYRSLHTAVVGPQRKPLEIQIRTWEMHQTSELGIAAHWRYKEKVGRDTSLEAKIAWLRSLLEWQQELADAREFVDSLKTDLFPTQVYVLTPKGDIVDLPAGATPIDFAYRIHTEIGDRCRGAKVNGKLVSLNYRLQNGDQVEIVTTKTGGPSRDWLNPHLGYVVTSRAKEKIRQWFKLQERTQNIAHGRIILEKELKRLGLEQMGFEEIAQLFRFKEVDDFLAAIGYGEINVQQIVNKLAEEKEEEEPSLPTAPPPPLPSPVVQVLGTRDVLTKVAHCCNPLPGDDIVGYVTRGRGITVHRRSCRNILRQRDRERLIEVEWGEGKHIYPVVIKVVAFDRKGLLKDITTIVEAEDVNMTSANATTSQKDRLAVITATLEISSMAQLSRILAKIESLKNVLEARRQTE